MKIALASDHGGYSLKAEIAKYLQQINIAFEDLGCNSEASVDYPDFAFQVSKQVNEGRADRGILVCGTGVGMAIAANKMPGIRAAAINDLYTARLTREHNNLNVLCLGGRVTAVNLALEIVSAFINIPFAGSRHQNRLDKIHQLEKGSQ